MIPLVRLQHWSWQQWSLMVGVIEEVRSGLLKPNRLR